MMPRNSSSVCYRFTRFRRGNACQLAPICVSGLDLLAVLEFSQLSKDRSLSRQFGAGGRVDRIENAVVSDAVQDVVAPERESR